MLEKLNKDMIEAMKAKDKEKLSVIRACKAALDKERIDKGVEVNEDLLTTVVSREIKMRKESIGEFEKGGRDDLVKQYQSEIDILKEYLPPQMDEAEIDSEIEKIFDLVKPESIKDMGKVMKEASAIFKGKADMGLVNSKIKDKLNSL